MFRMGRALNTKDTKDTKPKEDTKKTGRSMVVIVYEAESYGIMGACFEVYKCMGRGFLEAVYQECLGIELTERGIPFVPQQQLPIVYKGRTLLQFYKADFVCYDKIIVEVQAITELTEGHRPQVFNYLKATGMRLGILVNFGSYPKLEYDRVVR
jgi:GxxExxY protein